MAINFFFIDQPIGFNLLQKDLSNNIIVWGCPALWAGRAVSQLAGLLGPAAAKPLWSAAFGGPAAHPSACGGFAACPPQKKDLTLS
ncbi:hypothetical protein SGRA_1432 [Saprospira grandis str. Lewin]|uniref:Uncharacterized protein n=1 Tax=Saprospira grandis (strain Lewin) TaxID=984262 RepID=H6L7U6_SAPGL|nr:hypothetical protein SGRA_1432 [Saprospira grandis str. Lewin]